MFTGLLYHAAPASYVPVSVSCRLLPLSFAEPTKPMPAELNPLPKLIAVPLPGVVLMVYCPLATALFTRPVAEAIAESVCVEPTNTGPVYGELEVVAVPASE